MLLGARPAQEDIACGLHDTLAFHDPKSLMRIPTLTARQLQHRPARFLDLEEEWIIVIGQKQREIASRPNTSHPNNFYRTVLIVIALVQMSPIRLQRLLIFLGEFRALLFEISSKFVDMVDDRRVVLNLPKPVDNRSELRNYRLRGLLMGLLHLDRKSVV